MIDIRIKVVKVDSSEAEYSITPKVQVEFERHFKTGIAKAFGGDNIHMEYLYWLGWAAQRAAGPAPKPFDGWLDEVRSVEVADDPAPFDEGP